MTPAMLGAEALLWPVVTRRLIEEFAVRAEPPGASPTLAPLTEREREVLALVATGLPTTTSPLTS